MDTTEMAVAGSTAGEAMEVAATVVVGEEAISSRTTPHRSTEKRFAER
jgi:hypothetical protein